MKDFVRVTKLTDIGGRADYISNPKRQEEIVAKSAPVDWEPYQRFERENQRTATKNNEGREIVVALPNEWAKLRTGELSRRAQALAETAAGKKTDLQWAVHWNKARTNLHLHVIFSERQREKQVGVWDRDIYHTAEGKVARTKADRARLPDGSVAPPVHRKGEAKGGFTVKDTKYVRRNWVPTVKTDLREQLRIRWGVQFDKPNLLHEYHEGKGKEATAIREKNEAIRATNRNYAEYLMAHPDVSEFAKATFEQTARKASQRGEVTTIEWSEAHGSMVGTKSLTEWREKEAVKREQPVKAPTGAEKPSKGFFERVSERISSFTAKWAEKAAQKAQEAEAKRQAEEDARKSAESVRAAQRAAEVAAHRERLVAIDGLKQICEERWRTAEECRFNGWKSIDAERALDAMREKGDAFPLVYRDDYGGFSTKIFKAEQWQEAKEFADRTEATFNHWRERLGGKSAYEQYKEKQAAMEPRIKAKLTEQERTRGQSHGGYER